jgi:hypothetical protein
MQDSLFLISKEILRISFDIKSPPGGIALRRLGNMSQMRPAAGGESRNARFYLNITEILQLGRR